MDLLEVVSVNEAIDRLVWAMERLKFKKIKTIDTTMSLGYILAEDIVAKENLPNFQKSTMDGYAINFKDSLGATDSIPSILKIIETIEIGEVYKHELKSGQASRIFTGGMLPKGADAVIPVEYTEEISKELVSIYKPVVFMENVIDIGDDCKKGDVYLRKGKIIDSQVIAMAASLGYDKLSVYEKLSCKLLSTGDEIIGVSEKLLPAKARDVNSYMLLAMLEESGIEVKSIKHLKDDRALIKKELEEDYDIIFISGSSSKGNKDFVPSICKELNPGMIFHGISVKPGKPTSLSINNKTLILGLPGNPISAYSVYKAIFEKAFRKYFQVEDFFELKCYISRNISQASAKSLVQLVDIERKDDRLLAIPIFGFSNNISLLKRAKGYFIIDEYSEGIRENEEVWVKLIR